MSATESSVSSRLDWAADQFDPVLVSSLIGPGAPFELVREMAAGYERTVFARQPPNLRAMFDATVARQPDAMFMVAGDRSWTFAEAIAEIDLIARLLRADFDIGRGDRVAFVAANSPEYGLAMWAVISLGAIVTSLNGWWTAHELAYGVELTGPRLILGDARRLERLQEATVPSDVPILELADLRDAAVKRVVEGPIDLGDVEPDDPAVILFTSGTTGKPKGATLSHRNIVHFIWSNLLVATLASASAPAKPSAPSGRQPASILASPMFHVSGMLGILMTGPAMGVKSIFPPPGRWDVTRHLEMTVEHGVTIWSGVPTQFWHLLRHPDFETFDLSCLASVGGGGAPFPPELVREFQEKLPWVTLGQGYGMSETVGLGTRTGGELMISHPDSVGVANVSVEVEIRDPIGGAIPPGEVGEIYLRTAAIFVGYWNNPTATHEAVDDEGWYRTGDFGRIRDGLLYLESRMRDMILRGGENIYPIEIEHRLVEHADIEDAAVIGVDHPELGQEVKAFVVPHGGAQLSVSAVQEWVAAALARFKVPTHVEFRTSLPYTETGKVLKHQLEAEERAARQ